MRTPSFLSPAMKLLLMPLRLTRATPHLFRPVRQTASWLLQSREYTNFTYDLTPLNLRHLAHFIAHVSKVGVPMIEGYFNELDQDEVLREHLRDSVRRHPRGFGADEKARYARRLGWYALVRTLKPRVVVETGIDKGLGTCVLAAALLRNRAEGKPGRVYGTDINPQAGYLVSAPYSEVAHILYGDSIQSLNTIQEPIDLFINDSDHSENYEAEEYQCILPKLAPGAIVLGDNSHSSPALIDFSAKNGRGFLFFREVPKDHWYPGSGIGISFPT